MDNLWKMTAKTLNSPLRIEDLLN